MKQKLKEHPETQFHSYDFYPYNYEVSPDPENEDLFVWRREKEHKEWKKDHSKWKERRRDVDAFFRLRSRTEVATLEILLGLGFDAIMSCKVEQLLALNLKEYEEAAARTSAAKAKHKAARKSAHEKKREIEVEEDEMDEIEFLMAHGY